MAKTSDSTTRPAASTLPGGVATKTEARETHEMQNYARCEAVQSLLSLQMDDGGSGISPAGDGLSFPSSGSERVYEVPVYIDSDVATLYLGARASVPVGVGGIAVTIGGHAAAVLNMGSSDSTTVSTVDTGTGWQLAEVDLTQIEGDPSSGGPTRLWVRSVTLSPGSLPDPT